MSGTVRSGPGSPAVMKVTRPVFCCALSAAKVVVMRDILVLSVAWMGKADQLKSSPILCATVCMSLSPRPDRLTRISWSFGSVAASFSA